ncbi:fungal-specific transcription factor domain-containing protein [Halenospora varia]|nr:fungal-specific transcription factor domain-containing protein [Halenospora varia]
MTSTGNKRTSPDENNNHNSTASRASAPSKRSRTAHACDSCRVRKSRCDGARPVCDICTSMGLDCHYRGPAKQHHPTTSNDHVLRLESRLQAVEHMLRWQISKDTTDGSPQPSGTRDSESLDYQNGHGQSDMRNSDLPADRVESAETFDTAGDEVDGLAIISFRDEEGSSYFGPTSNHAFYIQVMTAVAGFARSGWTFPVSLNGNGAGFVSISRPATPPLRATSHTLPVRRTKSSPYALPPTEEIAELVEVFFSNAGKMFPYIHKGSVLDIVQTIRSASHRGLKRSSLCLINTVMAFAIVYGAKKTPTPETVPDGNEFVERALALLPSGTPQGANVESLQCWLLVLQYVQSSKGSTQIWGIHGAAMSLSLQLGMQRQTQAGNTLEETIANRVWWMCLLMDRMCSMTLGRPPLIPNSYMQAELPKNVDLDQPFHENEIPIEPTDEQPLASTGIFIHTLKLYMIVGDIIEKIYDQNLDNAPKRPASHLFQSIIEIEESLLDWKGDLPADVRIICKSELDLVDPMSEFLPSDIILSLRYLNTRALLHKEVFSRLLLTPANRSTGTRPNKDFAMLLEFGPKSLDVCLGSAVTSINIICRYLSSEELLPAWWFSIYYVFNSALIVFGAIVCLRMHGLQYRHHTSSSLLTALDAALETLLVLGHGTRLGLRSRKVLQVIKQIALSLAAGPEVNFPSGNGVGLAEHDLNGPVGTNIADTTMRTMSEQAVNEQAFSTFDFAGLESIFTPSWLNDTQQLFA